MESEERALPEQETPAAEAESPLPAAAAPAESGEGQAPAEGGGHIGNRMAGGSSSWPGAGGCWTSSCASSSRWTRR